MNKPQHILPFLTSMALFLPAGLASAAVIWDGTTNDLVSANQAITVENTFTTGSGFQSPAQGADYYPTFTTTATDHNPNFYAAKDTGAVTGFTVFKGGNADLLLRVQVAGATSGTFTSMIAWGAESGTLSSLSITGFNGFGGNLTNDEMHFVFQDGGGTWYASAATVGTGATISIPDLSAASWFSYTPHTAGVATIGAAATPASFDNVNLVGYYQEFTTTGGGGVFSNGFSADFTPVPEPSSAAFLGLGVLGLILRRKRK
jgi:hypothetical protein